MSDNTFKGLNCNIFSNVSQDTNEEEWLANRTKGIGGSDIGAICGVSPFTSARQIYLNKVNMYPEEFKPDDAAKERMHFGHILEPVVADEYARRTGAKLEILDSTLQHKDYPWALASIDRLIVDDEGNPIGILECKTTGEYMKSEWDSGEILASYIYQLNWYLWITGLTKGVFACLAGGNKFYSYEIYRNDELLNNTMIPAAQKFWNENVLKLVEPEMQSTDTEFANTVYSSVVKKSEVTFDDDLMNDLARTVVECKQIIKNTTLRMEESQNRIKDRIKDNEIGHTQDFLIKWSPRTQTRISTDLLKQHYPEILSKVSTTNSYRAMTIKEVRD